MNKHIFFSSDPYHYKSGLYNYAMAKKEGNLLFFEDL